MISAIKGNGYTDLEQTLQEINLSQRGTPHPKKLLVTYEYDSVSGDFSVSVRYDTGMQGLNTVKQVHQ